MIHIHAESRGERVGIHGDHILKIQLGLRGIRIEIGSREHIHVGICQLADNDGAVLCLLDHVLCQSGSVADARLKEGAGVAVRGAYDADDLQFLAVIDEIAHITLVVGHILPDIILCIVAVEIGCGYQTETQRKQLVVRPLHGNARILRSLKVLSAHHQRNGFLQLGGILQSQRIGGIVRQPVGVAQNQDHFLIAFRPPSAQQLILGGEQGNIVHHFVKNIRVHIGRHGSHAGNVTEQGGRVYLQDFVWVGRIDPGLDAVTVADGSYIVLYLIEVFLQVRFKGLQIVFADLGEHLADHGLFRYDAVGQLLGLGIVGTVGSHKGTHIGGLRLQNQRIIGKGILLNFIHIFLEACGKRQDQSNANDADRACKRGEQCSCKLGSKIVKAQGKSSQEGHGGAAQIPVFGRLHGREIGFIGVCVINDLAVPHPYDAVGIRLGQFRIVGDHDHKPILGHRFQQLHYLHAGVTVQCAGWLICQQNIRVVYQRTGDGHTLHLTAGHLVGLLVQLIAQPHILQCLGSTPAPFGRGDAGDGQGQLYVGKNGLMWDQIIALKHEADGVVSIGIPVPVRVFFCGDTVDDQITAVITVQTTDGIKHGSLAGAAGTQNGDKLVVAQVQTDSVQCGLYQIAGNILFANILDLKHPGTPFSAILTLYMVFAKCKYGAGSHL